MVVLKTEAHIPATHTYITYPTDKATFSHKDHIEIISTLEYFYCTYSSCQEAPHLMLGTTI